MNNNKYRAVLLAVVAVNVYLSVAFSLAQDAPNDAENQPGALAVDASLLNLPDGKDAAFYLDAYAKLKQAFEACIDEATSMEELVQSINIYAPATKVVYENLSKLTEKDSFYARSDAFTFYIITLILNDKIDETKEVLRHALDDPNLKDVAQSELGGVQNVDWIRAIILTNFNSRFLVNACRKEDVDRMRALGVKMIEDALTNDVAFVDELDRLLSCAASLSIEFHDEMRDKIIETLSKSGDQIRRDFAEVLLREKEEHAKYLERQRRCNELQGNEMEVNGLYLDNSEIDWSSYRDKVTLVDVWPSWTFCMGPTPNKLSYMLKLYRKYHDSGFEILSYSTDDVDALKEFADAARLPWKVASSKLTQVANEKDGKDYFNLAAYYGIEDKGTSVMMLVDRNGKVIEKFVGRFLVFYDDKELEKLVEEAIPEPREPTGQTIDACRTALDAFCLLRTKEARESLENNKELKPLDKFNLLCGLAQISFDCERWEEAVQYAERAIAIASDDVIANETYDAAGSLFRIAWMLVSCPKRELRNGKLALEAVQKAAQKTHCSSEFRRLTLAAAYAEVGDFENATLQAQKALELAKKTIERNQVKDEDYLEKYQRAVELFSNRETWRD